jgi:hypothetical protein
VLATVRPDPSPWIAGADRLGMCSLESRAGLVTGSARQHP